MRCFICLSWDVVYTKIFGTPKDTWSMECLDCSWFVQGKRVR